MIPKQDIYIEGEFSSRLRYQPVDHYIKCTSQCAFNAMQVTVLGPLELIDRSFYLSVHKSDKTIFFGPKRLSFVHILVAIN